MSSPYTTWTLAATSAGELHDWLASFRQVLSEGTLSAHKTPPPGGNGYAPMGQGGWPVNAYARTPVVLGAQTEEVM